MPQVYDKDLKDLSNEVKFEVSFEQVAIYVLAVHKDEKKNHQIRIPCVGCLPIKGYVYSAINDTYTASCYEHIGLGVLNISYKMTIPGTGGWSCRVPLPESVIKRYLDVGQRRHLLDFKKPFSKFPEGDIRFEYMQMILAGF